MRYYNELSIKTKISLIAIIGTIGFVIYLQNNYMIFLHNSEKISTVQSVQFPIFDKLNKAQLDLLIIKDLFTSAVSSADMDMIKTANTKGHELLNKFDEISALDPSLNDKLDELRRIFTIYLQAGSKVSTAMMDDDADFSALTNTIQTYNSSYETFHNQLSSLTENNYATFIDNLDKINKSSERALTKGLVLVVIIVLVVIVITIATARYLSNKIQAITDILHQMSEGNGDLRMRLPGTGSDELGLLTVAFNAFVSKLQNIISDVRKAADQLNTETQSLSLLAEQSEGNIVKQQNEIFQVSSAVEEMSATSQEVARNAIAASESTLEAKDETGKSRSVIDLNISSIKTLNSEMLSASTVINNLKDESHNIGTVLDVIKGIAEQTNLLALNAAIEAARAGEQGRGFAVVADEVRTLAKRTQDSTSEIEKIIESLQKGATNAAGVMATSSEQTNTCVEQSEITNESLNLITHHVNTINDINVQVASAAEEQSAVSTEISQNIAIINMSSEQTVDNAKQTHMSSMEIYKHVCGLNELINGFEV